ncbi:Jjj1 protein [Martiniozyma asiatica (nom. inval.)]|nr:Jjj1 protein [Martiniozyma asiatica]
MKTDYYELLDVSSDATDIELKKAYRKKALRLHPDKNPDDVENAARLFNEVRLAYETLSDPQERSWYDSHKYQILMEDEDRNVYQEEDTEVYYAGTSIDDIQKYFNPALYQNIDDTINGVYAVISVLLDKIASEEVSAGKQQKIPGFDKFKDDTSFANVCDPKELLFPRIGNSKAEFDNVRIFYKIWSGFQSVKTFNWCDEYRYSAAPDRRTRRLMEKENKKLRDQARKDYNEIIRKLILYIKKIDPRMDPKLRKQEEKRKQTQRNNELKKQAEIEKQHRKEQRKQYVEQDWQQVDPDELAEIEEQLARLHAEEQKLNGEKSDDDEDIDSYECVICNKIFKSVKQFQDHERSKKHIKLLKELQKEMQREGIELGIDDENFINIDENGDYVSDEIDEFEDALEEIDDLSYLDDLTNEQLQELLDNELIHGLDSQHYNETDNSDLGASESSVEIDDDLSDVDIWNSKEVDDNKIVENSETTKKPKRTKEEEKLAELEKLLGKTTLDSGDDDDDWSNMNKGKSKKNKRKPKQAISETDNVSNKPSETVDIETCSVCHKDFSSRNKLFQHVKSSGHAAPPAKVKKGKKDKKDKKNKKK